MTQSTPPPARRWEKIVVTGLIVLGVLLTIFFGGRAARSYIRIQQTGLQPGVTDVEAIRGWMTIPYIATAYQVPEAYIFEQIDIPQEGNQNRSLGQLNRAYMPGQPGAMIEAVKAAIRRYQTLHPPPAEATDERD